MKNIILFILVLVASSCSTVVEETPSKPEPPKPEPPSYVDEMDKKYPFWNVKLQEFRVEDQDAGFQNQPSSTDPVENAKARVISVESKRSLLRIMNTIRFVVNTPEFANLLRTKLFYSSGNGEGAFGSIKKGDPMSSERLLTVVRRGSFYSQFIKKQGIAGTDAHANVGSFLYVASNKELVDTTSKYRYVAYHNNASWDDWYQDKYWVGVVFHELLHNMGFNHTVPRDATLGMQNEVFRVVYDDPKWKAKYKEELEAYIYYTTKYEHFLQAETVVDKSRQFNGTDLFTADQTKVGNTYNDEIEEVCFLQKDGTYKLVKMRNGRMI